MCVRALPSCGTQLLESLGNRTDRAALDNVLGKGTLFDQQFSYNVADRSVLFEAGKVWRASADFCFDVWTSVPLVLPRCCDRFLFAVHPVFGAFFHVTIPITTPGRGNNRAGVSEPFAKKAVCFRRKFLPQPKIQALTPDSVCCHTRAPAVAPVPSDAMGRVCAIHALLAPLA